MFERFNFIGSDFSIVERVISGNNGRTETFKSSSDHFSNGTEELELFVSGGGSGGVLFSESGAHRDGKGKELAVSVDLLRSFGDKELLFKDALGHFFEMVFELLLHSHKVSDGLFESGSKGEIGLLGHVLFLVVVSKGVLDVLQKLVEHTSNSLNSGDVKEHIVLSGGHLGEHSDDWSIRAGELDLDTGLKELFGVGGELDEGSILSNEIVEEVDGTLDNRHSTSVMGDSLDVKGVTFLSSSGSGGKGSSGVGEVLDGLGKIDLSLISGLGAGGEVVGGSSEGRFTFVNFVVSEGLFFITAGAVSSKHTVMLSLFLVDLVFELVEESFNVGEWTAGLDLRFDLSEEVGEGWVVDGVQLSGLESEAGSDEAKEENSFHYV
jgi:hypothetical protein